MLSATEKSAKVKRGRILGTARRHGGLRYVYFNLFDATEQRHLRKSSHLPGFSPMLLGAAANVSDSGRREISDGDRTNQQQWFT